MKVVEEKIGGRVVFFQALDDEIELVASVEGIRDTETIGIKDTVQEGYQNLKQLIKDLAEGFGEEIMTIEKDLLPRETHLELSLALSAKLGTWIVSGTGQYGIKLKLTWKTNN